MFENNSIVYVYHPGAGTDSLLGSKSFHLVICCKFFPLNDFVIAFPI